MTSLRTLINWYSANRSERSWNAQPALLGARLPFEASVSHAGRTEIVYGRSLSDALAQAAQVVTSNPDLESSL